MQHRTQGYAFLQGRGLEIGALNQPALVPDKCEVVYCDAISKQEAIQYFPEVDANLFVDVDYIADLDKESLSSFSDEEFDFVILNHVIEHVANPIRVVQSLFRIVSSDGVVIISAPDKRYTFDVNRTNTSFEHLWTEYKLNTTAVTDEHYLDFLQAVHPDIVAQSSTADLKHHIDNVRRRREHAHVWDSNTFRSFLNECMSRCSISADCVYESSGDENLIEYFSVWKK